MALQNSVAEKVQLKFDEKNNTKNHQNFLFVFVTVIIELVFGPEYAVMAMQILLEGRHHKQKRYQFDQNLGC